MDSSTALSAPSSSSWITLVRCQRDDLHYLKWACTRNWTKASVITYSKCWSTHHSPSLENQYYWQQSTAVDRVSSKTYFNHVKKCIIFTALLFKTQTTQNTVYLTAKEKKQKSFSSQAETYSRLFFCADPVHSRRLLLFRFSSLLQTWGLPTAIYCR